MHDETIRWRRARREPIADPGDPRRIPSIRRAGSFRGPHSSSPEHRGSRMRSRYAAVFLPTDRLHEDLRQACFLWGLIEAVRDDLSGDDKRITATRQAAGSAEQRNAAGKLGVSSRRELLALFT